MEKGEGESDDILRQQIASLRKIRDGKVPFSSETYRSAKKSQIAKFAPIIDTPEAITVDKNVVLRRKSVSLDGRAQQVSKALPSDTREDIENTEPSRNIDAAPSKSPSKVSVGSSTGDIVQTLDKSQTYPAAKADTSTITNDIGGHKRLVATVSILLDTLEEQGVLRALLEHQHSDMSSQQQTKYDVNLELRYQGALVELEKTVQKLIGARMECAEEKKLRLSTERALDISCKQLEQANAKYAAAKEELREVRRALTVLQESRPSNRQSFPPSGSSSTAHDRPQGPAPPPPPPPEEEYEGNADGEEVSDDETYDAIGSAVISESPSVTDRSASITKESTGAVHSALHALSDHNGSDGRSTPSGSPSRARSDQRPSRGGLLGKGTAPASKSSSVLLDIDLGDGNKGTINVTSSSNPIELAYEFVYAHGLNPDYLDPLVDYISRTMRSLADEQSLENMDKPASPHIGDDTLSRKDTRGYLDLAADDSAPTLPPEQSPQPEKSGIRGPQQGKTTPSISTQGHQACQQDSAPPIAEKQTAGKLDAVRDLLANGQIQSPDPSNDTEQFSDRTIDSDTPTPPPRARKQRTMPEPPTGHPDDKVQMLQQPPGIPYYDEGGDYEEDRLFEVTSPSTPSTSRSITPSDMHSRPTSSRSSPSEDNSTVFNELSRYSPSPVMTENHSDEEVEEVVSPYGHQGVRQDDSAERTHALGLSMSSDGFFNVSEDITAEMVDDDDDGEDETGPTRAIMSRPVINKDKQRERNRIHQKAPPRSPAAANTSNSGVRANHGHKSPSRSMHDGYHDDEMEHGQKTSSLDDISSSSGSDPEPDESRGKIGPSNARRDGFTNSQGIRNETHEPGWRTHNQTPSRSSQQSDYRGVSREDGRVPPTGRQHLEQTSGDDSVSFDAAHALHRLRNSTNSGTYQQHQSLPRVATPQSQSTDYGRPRSPQRSVASRYSGGSESIANSREIIDDLHDRTSQLDPLDVAIEVFDSATALANEGNIEDAVPLYLHALKTFEEFNYDELPMIREEIWRWVSLADQTGTSHSVAADMRSAMLHRRQERSRSPQRERSHSPRTERSRSPRKERSRSPRTERSRSPRKERSRSPRTERLRSPRTERSRSPQRERSHSPRKERSRSPEQSEKEKVRRGNGHDSRASSAPPRASKDAGAGDEPKRSSQAKGTPVRHRRVSRQDAKEREGDRNMHISELSDMQNSLTSPTSRIASAPDRRPLSTGKTRPSAIAREEKQRMSRTGDIGRGRVARHNFDIL